MVNYRPRRFGLNFKTANGIIGKTGLNKPNG